MIKKGNKKIYYNKGDRNMKFRELSTDELQKTNGGEKIEDTYIMIDWMIRIYGWFKKK